MSDETETPSGEDSVSKQPASTRYVIGAAAISALVLGTTIFLLVRGFQWRGALAELRSEPGIEILSVDRIGLFKKRLLGLRDPLAPDPASILRKHNIGPLSSELFLTEYHSLNTRYAIDRENQRRRELEEVKKSVVSAIAEFSSEMDAKRERDLERITRMLFEARFPEAMESVDIEWKNDRWFVKGELFQPRHRQFVAEAPNYVVDGELDFSGLVDLTETKTAALREEIESTNLYSSDLDGKFVHVERIKRLVSTYDEVCRVSEMARPRLQLEKIGADVGRIAEVKSILMSCEHISGSRFLPDFALPRTDDAEPIVSLKIVPSPAP